MTARTVVAPREVVSLLEDAITRIAHHACRLGESGDRSWPDLSTLPAPGSWRCVGERYAPQVAALLLAPLLRPAPAPARGKRTGEWVLRHKVTGGYWPIGTKSQKRARRYPTKAAALLGLIAAYEWDVVALTRHEPRDWAKLVESEAEWRTLASGLSESLSEVKADRDRLRLACDAIAEERDALKARAEAAEGRYERLLTEAVRIDSAAEAPAPARVLRDGEGGCEPLPVDKNGRVVSVGGEIECGSGGFYAVTGIYGAKVEAAGYAHGLLDPSIRNTRPAPALDAAAPLQCSSTSATGTQCAHGHGHVGAHHDGTAAWRDEPAKPQPFAGLYVYATGTGYVLTRRGCDLLDALARKP